MNDQIKKTIKNIVAKFNTLNGTTFAGIPNYESKTTGEIASHTVVVDFDYGKAVEKDLKALKSATELDVQKIADTTSFSTDLIRTAICKLAESFTKNMNVETASAQSEAQKNAYIPVTNSIKYHIESGNLHIFALAIQKKVHVAGTYKTVNSRDLTIAQNAVKKYFNFSTAKYRQFIISPEQLSGVNLDGQKFEL